MSIVKHLILILVLLFGGPVFAQERPTVALPIELRQANYVNPITLEGSCTHATSIMLMRWQLQFENADEWRETYSGGDWADTSWNAQNNHAQKLNEEDIDFAYVTNGDEQFLAWALATRRGAGLTVMGGRHAVLLVHLDDEWAGIIDNNDINDIKWVPRDRLINEWHNSNSWAWTVVGNPAPPLPK